MSRDFHNPFEKIHSGRTLIHSTLAVALSIVFAGGFRFIGIALPSIEDETPSVMACVLAGLGFYLVVARKATSALLIRMFVVYALAFGGRILTNYFVFWDGRPGMLLGWAFGLYITRVFKSSPRIRTVKHHRGSQLDTPETADALLTMQNRKLAEFDGGESVAWAGMPVPVSAAQGYFCAIGTPGSGKSLMHLELLRSVVPRITRGSKRRLLFLDMKAEILTQFQAMKPSVPVLLINPFDARGWAWDIAQDFDEANEVRDYASRFIITEKGDTPFFAQAARTLLGGVFQFLITRSPGQWTLADVVHLCENGERLRETFQRDPQLWAQYQDCFEPPITFQGVKQTLNNSLLPLRTIAALWQDVPRDRHISLKRWLRDEESILVLGSTEQHAATLRTLTQAIFSVIAKATLTLPGSPAHDRLWFFIDELAAAGKLDGLAEFLATGRSKGLRAVVGFQSIPGMYAVYGQNEAAGLIGIFSNVSVLTLSCPVTAKWAVERFGKHEAFVTLPGNVSRETLEQGDKHIKYGTQLMTRDTVLEGEFLSVASSTSGFISGYHIISAAVRTQFFHRFHVPIVSSISNVDFQPKTTGKPLPQWSKQDLERLHLDTPPASTREASPESANQPPASPPTSNIEDTLKAISNAKRWRK